MGWPAGTIQQEDWLRMNLTDEFLVELYSEGGIRVEKTI